MRVTGKATTSAVGIEGMSSSSPIDLSALSSTLVDALKSQGLVHEAASTSSMVSTQSELEGKLEKMEAELVQVAEGLQRDSTDTVLADENEQRGAEFLAGLR